MNQKIFDTVNKEIADVKHKEYTEKERLLLLKGAFSDYFDGDEYGKELFSISKKHLDTVYEHLEIKGLAAPYVVEAYEKEPFNWMGNIPDYVKVSRIKDQQLETSLKVVGYVIEQQFPLKSNVDRQVSANVHNIRLSFVKI